ncbi:MAG: CoA transferase, partial [Alphaproteobacteria bacterium]|nr:CoA transferase [Alphaproteobacteria bacterium]
FATATAFEWENRLSALDVPAGKVRGLAEIMDSKQLAARDMFHTIADRQTGCDYRLPGVGFKFSHNGSAVTDPPPRLGQDTDAVLSDLGYDPAQISALRTGSVVA